MRKKLLSYLGPAVGVFLLVVSVAVGLFLLRELAARVRRPRGNLTPIDKGSALK